MPRYYSQSIGRFLGVDPGHDQDLQFPLSWNSYQYVRSSPVVSTDPDGEFCVPCAVAGAVVGGLGSAAWSVATQAIEGKSIDQQKVLAAGIGGAISGAAAGFTGGASLLAGTLADAVGGIAERAIDGDAGTAAIDPLEITFDLASGVAGEKVGERVASRAEAAVLGSAAHKVEVRVADSNHRSTRARPESRQIDAKKEVKRVAEKPAVIASTAGQAASTVVSSSTGTAARAPLDKKEK